MNNQNFKKRVAVLLAGTMALSAAPVNVFNAFAPVTPFAPTTVEARLGTPGTPATAPARNLGDLAWAPGGHQTNQAVPAGTAFTLPGEMTIGGPNTTVTTTGRGPVTADNARDAVWLHNDIRQVVEGRSMRFNIHQEWNTIISNALAAGYDQHLYFHVVLENASFHRELIVAENGPFTRVDGQSLVPSGNFNLGSTVSTNGLTVTIDGDGYQLHVLGNTSAILVLDIAEFNQGTIVNPNARYLDVPVSSWIRTTSNENAATMDFINVNPDNGNAPTYWFGGLGSEVNNARRVTIANAAVATANITIHEQQIHNRNFSFDLRLHETIRGNFDNWNGTVLELVAPAGFAWATPSRLADSDNGVTVTNRWGDNNVQVGFTRPLNNNTVLRLHVGSNADFPQFTSENAKNPITAANRPTAQSNLQTAGNLRTPAVATANNWLQLENLQLVYTGDFSGANSREITGTIRNATMNNQHGDRNDGNRGSAYNNTNTGVTNFNNLINILPANQSVNFGTLADWAVTMEVIDEDLPTLLNGRLLGQDMNNINADYHRAAKVRISERIPQSWHDGRNIELTLPEGVHIRQAVITDANLGRGTTAATSAHTTQVNDLQQTGVDGHFNLGRQHRDSEHITINNNSIIIGDLQRQIQNELIVMDLTLYLSIEPGFTGDIELSLGGRGLHTEDYNTPYVVIAEAINPIEVIAQQTNIRLGYQFLPVGNFSIVENVAGALIADQEVFISITDQIFSEFAVAPNFNHVVSEGDLRVTQMRTPVGGIGLMQGANAAHIIFEVANASSVPSTIEFSNLSIRQVMVSPMSTVGYDVVVWGPAVAQNVNLNRVQQQLDGSTSVPGQANSDIRTGGDSGILSTTAFLQQVNVSRSTAANLINPRDLFHTIGYSAPFITIGTTGIQVVDVELSFSQSGVVTRGGEVIAVPEHLGQFENINGVGMLPARLAFALLLEVEDYMDPELFIWSNAERRFTIDPAGRNIQFAVGNTEMIVGGIGRQILTGEGADASLASPVINPANDRMMLPVRAFADALGLTTSWDAATNTVTLSPQ